MIKIIKIIKIIIIYIFCLNKFNLGQEPKLNTINKHSYLFLNETFDNNLDAELKCSKIRVNNNNNNSSVTGYLATFTTFDELTSVIQLLGNDAFINSWISGNDLENKNVWKFSNGSFEGKSKKLIYDSYIDKYYSLCLFQSKSPNINSNRNSNGIHTIFDNGSVGQVYFGNEKSSKTTSGIICEFNQFNEEPYIPTISTKGGKVIVSGLSNFDLLSPTMKIEFTHVQIGFGSFQCSNIIKINSSHAQCTIPVGIGKYTYVVTDGINTASQYWSYEMPYVSAIYPSFNSGDKILIIGDNFGIDSSQITILFSNTGVYCNSIIINTPHQNLTCTLATSITTTLLPVKITISTVQTTSYRVPVYYVTDSNFYSIFQSQSSFETSLDFTLNSRTSGMNGQMIVITNPTSLLVQFFNKIYSLDLDPVYNNHCVWQNLYWKPETKKFYYLNGLNKDTEVIPYYNFANTLQDTWTSNSRFCLNLLNNSLTESSNSVQIYASTLIQFPSNVAPLFKFNKTINVDPMGDNVELDLLNFGTLTSIIKVIFRSSYLTYEADYENGKLIIFIPSGLDGPYEIVVIVDGRSTEPSTQFIDYYGPIINSISKVTTQGGTIVIDGNYFTDSISNIQLLIPGCTSLVMLEQGTKLQCLLVQGSGNINAGIQVGNKLSPIYNYTYQEPDIDQIEISDQFINSGSIITLIGSSFGIETSNINVTVGSYQCKNIVIIESHTKISCNVEQVFPINENFILYLTVSGLKSNSVKLLFTRILCGTCYNNGLCDTSTGYCKCKENVWTGSNCSTFVHYVKSIIPSNEQGGEASFIGEFGNAYLNPSITIGGLDCPIQSKSSTLFKCIAPPGTGIKSISFTQNGLTFNGLNMYQYINSKIECPSDCSNNGECNYSNGECNCYTGYSSFDCSIKTGNYNNGGSTGSNSTIDFGTGGTNITNQEINFQIYFKSLIEYNPFTNLNVQTYSLQNNWKLNSTIDNQYILIQNFGGIGDDNYFSLVSKIEEITNQDGKQFEFAGTSFKLLKGSIKFSISISNYTYQNNLNTLKLELVSSLNENQVNKQDQCIVQTDTETKEQSSSLFNYIKILKNDKVLEGRFINRVVSDNVPTFLSTTITSSDQDSVIVTLNLPHCTNCTIDPDFSVLIDPNIEKSKCNNNNNRKWVLPVAIVVPIVGVSLIIIISYFAYKRYRVHVKVQMYQLKMLNK